MPVLRARDRLAGLAPGALLTLIADDPLVTLDVPAFCAREGHEVVASREEPAGVFALTIRRGV